MADSHQQQNKPVTGYPAAQPTQAPAAAATAYAYPAPPSYYAPPPPRPSFAPHRATFLRRVIAAAIAVLVIMGTISFILWLVLRPRLPEFSVSSVSASSLNLSSSQLSASWDIAFSVRNPNKKMTVDYDSVVAFILYDSIGLADTNLPPFSQSKGNLTTVRARLAAVATYVGDGISKDLSADRGRGTVEFHVRLDSLVRFRSGAWRTRVHLMRVMCRHVAVGFSSPGGSGSLSGAPRGCDVNL